MSKVCYTSLRRTASFILLAVLMIAVTVGVFLWMLTIEPDIYEKDSKVGIPEALPKEMGYTFYPAKDICDNIAKNYNIELDKRKLVIKDPIKSFGTYVLDAKIYNEVVAKVTVIVTDAE